MPGKIAINCPGCGKRLTAPEGIKPRTKVSCTGCSNVFRFEDAKPIASTAQPQPAAPPTVPSSESATRSGSKSKLILGASAICCVVGVLAALLLFGDGESSSSGSANPVGSSLPDKRNQVVARGDTGGLQPRVGGGLSPTGPANSDNSTQNVRHTADDGRLSPNDRGHVVASEAVVGRPPSPRALRTIDGKPVEFVDDVVYFRLSGSAFRPMRYGYPLAERSPSVFMGGHDGFAWRFPNKVEKRKALWQTGVVSDYDLVAMPYAQLWAWKQVEDSDDRKSPNSRLDFYAENPPGWQNYPTIQEEIERKRRQDPVYQFQQLQVDDSMLTGIKDEDLVASDNGNIVHDVIIDGTRIVQLGQQGELHVLGEWKPEYWERLFSIDLPSFDDAPEFMREKLRQEEYEKQFSRLQSFRSDSHLNLDQNLLRRYLQQEEGTKPLLNDDSGQKALKAPESYPWGRIGLMRLGNTFYAFTAYTSIYQASPVINLATGEMTSVKQLFGVGVGVHPQELLDEQGLGTVLSATSSGLICQRVSGSERGKFDHVRIGVDGSQAVLATGQPRLGAVAQFGEVAVVAETAADPVRRLGTLSPDGTVKWLPLIDDESTEYAVIQKWASGVIGRQWVVTLMSAGDEYREVCFGLDEELGEVRKMWDFRSPANHIKYSKLPPHKPTLFRSPFRLGAKRYFLAGNGKEFSVFDAGTGHLQDLEKRQAAASQEPVDIMQLPREQSLLVADWNAAGTPKFRAFDCNGWVWREATLGTPENWQKLTRANSPKWSPLLTTKYGVWLASPAIAENGRLQHVLIFVRTASGA